jgi:cytochrome oxidase Cu insertion factor (SCO1/SenC/PrrC family)
MFRLLAILIFCCFCNTAFAQADSTTAPYLKFPELPPLQILLPDSTTKFTKESFKKGKPIMVMLFSPECSHCQQETREMTAHIKELKGVQVVMVTLNPFSQMKQFVEDYGLANYDNIIVGKDLYVMLPSFYAIHNLPFHAFYDKKGALVKAFEGSMKFADILSYLKK